MADSKFAVIGLGQFGLAIAKKLASKGAEVLAIDRNMERVDLVKDIVAYAAALDSTDIKALSSQNIADMDAVVVAIGENIEGLLLTTVLLLELKAKRIIARAMSSQQHLILEKLGVKEILSPEDEVGTMIAEMLLKPHIKSFLSLPDGHEIAEIVPPNKVVHRTIEEIDFEESYRMRLITIKRFYEETIEGRKVNVEHLLKKFNRDTVIKPTDMLIVLGESHDISKFLEINR